MTIAADRTGLDAKNEWVWRGLLSACQKLLAGPGVAGLINYKWGTPDDLYTHDLYSAIVDRIASKLALCFGTLFSYQHTKTKVSRNIRWLIYGLKHHTYQKSGMFLTPDFAPLMVG